MREAELLEHAGRLAILANRPVDARERLDRAIALFADAGEPRAAARASAALTPVDISEGRMEAGAARLERALAELEQGEATPELAEALANWPGCASSSGTPTRPRRCSSGRSPSRRRCS